MKRFLAIFLVVTLFLLTFPIRQIAAPAPKGNGALAGHIYSDDMRTPARDVVVKLRNVSTMKEYESEPTDTEGMYRIPGIEEGRYVMGVLGPGGYYNFHYSIMIKADALAKLSLAMKPGDAPVMLQEGVDTNKKVTIMDFFKSPAGILTLVIAAELTLFAIVLSEGEASPVID